MPGGGNRVTEVKQQFTPSPSTARWGETILNQYGAPKLSELTACGAPHLNEPPNHFATFILNSVFIRTHPDPAGRLILMFGRRILHAMNEYSSGRRLLIGYLENLPQTNTHFLQALTATTHFEQSIELACQATAFLKRMIVLANAPPLDDDRAERLRKICNRSKHFDEDLVDKKIPDADITAPVWLTNNGISSTKASVTFDELHSVLTELLAIFKSLAEVA
jgi:hypothetical protein